MVVPIKCTTVISPYKHRGPILPNLLHHSTSSAYKKKSSSINPALAIAVLLGGPVSGGAYNPAVAIALYQANRLPKKDLLPYIVVEILGAIFAFYIFKKFVYKTVPKCCLLTTHTIVNKAIDPDNQIRQTTFNCVLGVYLYLKGMTEGQLLGLNFNM